MSVLYDSGGSSHTVHVYEDDKRYDRQPISCVCVGRGNIYTAHRTIRYRYFLPVSLSHVCLLSVVLLALTAVGNSGVRDRFIQQNKITRQHSDVSETNVHPTA